MPPSPESERIPLNVGLQKVWTPDFQNLSPWSSLV
jgi:hypothetical protein